MFTRIVAFLLLALAPMAFADVDFKVVGDRMPALETNVFHAIRSQFNMDLYRQVRLQMPATHGAVPRNVVVLMFSKRYHRVEVISVDLDGAGNVVKINKNHHLNSADPISAKCPDPSVQFIAFAPNDDELEQGVTIDVAKAAIAKGLKTVQMLKGDATTQNYLNYMACPNLLGNFYDGDANPDLITTADGTLAAHTIQALLNFHYKLTNIWLACEAFNDPFKSIMIKGVQSQKYAAGINDLLVGPSDNAAACTMKAALNGQPMKAAFDSCYKQFDEATDQWGFEGNGSDYFGQ